MELCFSIPFKAHISSSSRVGVTPDLRAFPDKVRDQFSYAPGFVELSVFSQEAMQLQRNVLN